MAESWRRATGGLFVAAGKNTCSYGPELDMGEWGRDVVLAERCKEGTSCRASVVKMNGVGVVELVVGRVGRGGC